MYESPINLIEKQIAFDIDKAIEGEVWKVTKEIGIDVNKEELIKALQYDRNQYEKGYCDGLNAHKWIPVSERLPEDGEECIITIRERWGEDEEWDYETTTAYYHNDKWIPSYDVWEGQELEITAWMPLPEPYKAESEDNCGAKMEKSK